MTDTLFVRPVIVNVVEAFATVRPAVGLEMTTVHKPLALVAPLPVDPLAAPQVPPVMLPVAPFELAIDVVTVTPDAGPKPVTPSPPCAAVKPSSC